MVRGDEESDPDGVSPVVDGGIGPKRYGERFVGPFWPRQSLYHGCVLGVEWDDSPSINDPIETIPGSNWEVWDHQGVDIGYQFGKHGTGGQYANRCCLVCGMPVLPAFWGATHDPTPWSGSGPGSPQDCPNPISCNSCDFVISTLANPGDVDVGIGHTQQEALAAIVSSQDPPGLDSEGRRVLEEQLVGFSQGLLDELDNPDGLYQYEQAVHQYTFETTPGGDIHDYAPSEFDTEDGDSVKNLHWCLDCDIILHNGRQCQNLSCLSTISSSEDTGCSSCGSTELGCPGNPTHELSMSRDPKVATYSAPRFFEPKDPSLVVTNALRSSRHGGDGNHTDDATLKCRLSGQYFERWFEEYHGTNNPAGIGKSVGNQELKLHGSIPPECYELHQEVARIDVTTYLYAGGNDEVVPNQQESFNFWHQLTAVFSSTELGQSFVRFYDPSVAVGWSVPWGITAFYGTGPFTYEQLNNLVSGGLTNYPLHSGILPSPVACNAWSPAWVPMFLDYKIDYTPHRHNLGNNNWALGDSDFDINDDMDVEDILATSTETLPLSGRSILTDSSGMVIASQLERLLEEEFDIEEAEASIKIICGNSNCAQYEKPVEADFTINNDDEVTITSDCPSCETNSLEYKDDGTLGALTTDEEEVIEDLAELYKSLDLLTVAFDDLNNELEEYFPDDALRAGIMETKVLKIIDAFGQILEIDESPSIAVSMETRDNDGNELPQFLLKPRIPQGARLKLHLLSSDDDSLPANAGTSDMAGITTSTPVCAFLLPDHIEWAMEVFDNKGDACGQLRVAERTWEHGGIQKGRLAWDPAPGSESAIGELPNSGNPITDSFLNKLVEISIQDEAENSDEEGVLSALLRAIDTTYWDMDPFGKGGDDIPSMFMGRPVAIVRARLCLEIDEREQTMNEKLGKSVFEICLGSLSKITDGLLGYFVNDDYSKFMSVYPTAGGSPVDPHLYDDPLTHQFLQFDPTIEVRPGQEVMLTLLMNPQASVHVTSCLLPQKEITLVRSHYEQAMNKIAPTFKVGPVLVDPQTVRMPIPDQRGLKWSWVFKESYTEWEEQPIADADHLAGLPKTKSTAFEGWIKLDIDESQEN